MAIVVITVVVAVGAVAWIREIDALDFQGGDPGAQVGPGARAGVEAGTGVDPEIELETDDEAMVAHDHVQGQDRAHPGGIPTDPATDRTVDLDALVIVTLDADHSSVSCSLPVYFSINIFDLLPIISLFYQPVCYPHRTDGVLKVLLYLHPCSTS